MVTCATNCCKSRQTEKEEEGKEDKEEEEEELKLETYSPFPLTKHSEQIIAYKDISFCILLLALGLFQLMVAVWYCCYITCLCNEATSVSGGAGVSPTA
jgi:hypothetical protein